jgi:S1-C subfamily serine protease
MRRIPFLMFHTKKHENYHRPSDDVDKLNLDGIQQVVRLLFRTVYTAAESPTLPRFRPAAMKENQSVQRRRSQPVRPRASRLGVAWDDKLIDKAAIKITRVSAGSAAERGGLRVGDRVLSFGDYQIDRADLFIMIVLAAENPVRVVVERDGETEPVELTLQLNESPQRLGVSCRTDDAEPGIVTVTRVTPGSAGDRAGLKPNHRIYAVSGRSFSSGDEFYKLVTTAEAPLKLLVEGRGQLREIEVKLLPKPATENSPRADAPGRREP